MLSTKFKKTRIVCTIGPVTESVPQLEKLLHAGMNVVRLNMSHGDHAEHRAKIVNARIASKNTGLPVAILLDLAGPKIRLGNFKDDARITKEAGDTWILTSDECLGTNERVSINYTRLPQEVRAGSIIMLDDGKKKLEVTHVEGNNIHCKVIVGGELKPRRGVNIPNGKLSIKAFTEKDQADLAFGIAEGVDIIAVSFVRYPGDIDDVKSFLTENNVHIPVIAKIETQEAIDDIDEIITRADGIMVARGDLAIEVPTPKVPLYQKMLIQSCNRLGKPVITATQMLESMIHNPVPTRAEVSDVANAMYDGTDAVMLSEETTLGSYPVEAVQLMSDIAAENEDNVQEQVSGNCDHDNIADTISESVAHTADAHDVVAIVAFTESGSSARAVARFKPTMPIVAITPHESTARELLVTRGIETVIGGSIHTFDEMFALADASVKKLGIAETGDEIVICAGLPFGTPGSTNCMMVHTVK